VFKSALVHERVECLNEWCAANESVHCDNTGRQRPQPAAGQSADEVFRQHGQAFLQRVVSGESDLQQSQRLRLAIVVGEQMRTHFVLQ